MKYKQFARLPMKVRISWIQDKLIEKNYLQTGESTPEKRDKKFIRALKAFQHDVGMTENADITEQLFNELNTHTKTRG